MNDLAQNGDVATLAFPNESGRHGDMKHISVFVRPLIKQMIVNCALRGTITRDRASKLIAELKLEAV